MKRSQRDIVLSKKKKRPVRSRLKSLARSEAEEEGWRSASDDSINTADSLTDTELTASEIAVMRGEIERILSEADLSQNNAPVVWRADQAQPRIIATQRQVTPQRPPLVMPEPRRDRNDTKSEETSIPVSKEPPILFSNPGQRDDSVSTSIREPLDRWEPMNPTLLKDNFDEPMASRNIITSNKIKQSPSSSDPTCTQSKSGAPAKPYSARGRNDADSSSPFGAERGPSDAAAVDGRYSACIVPPVAGFQGAPVCDECRFTCASCGRRSPDVNFTTYCADCSRPFRPPRETCRICQDEYAHRFHDKDDPYCNCRTKGRSLNKQSGGNSVSTITDDVPFAYSTKAKSSATRKPQTFQKQMGRPTTRQVWTTRNTITGYPYGNTSETTDEYPGKKPTGPPRPLADNAPTTHLPVSTDAQATLNWVPSTQHPCCCCEPQLYPVYVQPGHTTYTTTTCHCSPPEHTTCYCAGIPGGVHRMVSPNDAVCSAAGTHGSQWPVFYTGHPPAPYSSPPPAPFQGTSFRREDTWTEGSTVRKVVMEERKQLDTMQQNAKPAPLATPMHVRRPLSSPTPSERSSAPRSVTSKSSSWGRTLDYSPVSISRRCSYVTCVPQRSLTDIAWSTSRLGGAFSLSSANLRDVSRPESAPSLRKSSRKVSERRASTSSVGSARKASFQLSEPPLDTAGSVPSSRKSSLARSEARSPFIFSVDARKPSIRRSSKTQPSKSPSSSRKSSLGKSEEDRSPFIFSVSARKLSIRKSSKPEPQISAPSSRKSSVKEVEKVALPPSLAPSSRKSSVKEAGQVALLPTATSSRKSSQQPVYDSAVPATGFDVSRRASENQKHQIKPNQALFLACQPGREMVSAATGPDLRRASLGVGTERWSYAEASVGTRKESLRKTSLASLQRSEKGGVTTELLDSSFVTPPLGDELRRASTADSKKSVASARKASTLSTESVYKSGEASNVLKGEEQRQTRTLHDDKSSVSARKAWTGPNDESDEIRKIPESGALVAEEAHESEGVERSVKDSTEEGERPAQEESLSGQKESPPIAAVANYSEEYAKAAEATFEGLFSTSRTLYPESHLVIALGLLCILWVIAIILFSAVNHSPVPPPPTDSSSSIFTVITVTAHNETTAKAVSTTGSSASGTPTISTYTCSTPYCKREGDYLKSLLSNRKKPCDNFYAHVCDNWKSNALSNTQTGVGGAVSRDTLLEEQMEREVIDYFNNVNLDVQPALQLHQACIRSTQLQGTEATQDLKDIFKEYIGTTWPIPRSDSVMKHNHVWSLAGRLYREFGIDAFLAVAVGRQRNKLPLPVLEGPQMLFFKDYRRYSDANALFREAVGEAVIGLHSATLSLKDTVDDVYAVFNDLSERVSTEAKFEFKLSKVQELPFGMRRFILVVFEGAIGANATVIVRSPKFILQKLNNYVKVSEVPSLINYLGFRLVVRMAPFFPSSGFENLKRLFSLEHTGRVRPAPLDHGALCLRAVEAALPICVVKAIAKLRNASGNDLTNRMWLSQLESSFFRNTALLSWVDEFTYFVIRFRLAHTNLARFFPAWCLDAGQCNGSISQYGGHAVVVYRNLWKQRMNAKLGQVTNKLVPREPGFPFEMRSRYVWSEQTTYVPLGLINSSVPNNATLFAFHLSRVAVRLFHSLAPLLREEPTSLGAPYGTQYSNRSLELLRKLLDCLSNDLENVLRSTRTEFVVDPDDARYALLAQTAALGLAFKAFRDLLHVERIWKMSFRLSSLPELSSDQLFFVYYALDNCENSDATYQLRQYDMWQRLPPELAVNFPLRYMPRFGEAFKCSPGSPMRPAGFAAVCDVFNGTMNYRSKL